jgi:hypothetical protein
MKLFLHEFPDDNGSLFVGTAKSELDFHGRLGGFLIKEGFDDVKFIWTLIEDGKTHEVRGDTLLFIGFVESLLTYRRTEESPEYQEEEV